MAKKSDKKAHAGPRVSNRKARHDYHISEVLICGMELLGTEVKSLRASQAKIDQAFARVRGGQLYLVGATISPYPQAAKGMQHEPNRDRRLLAHRRQIAQVESHVKQKGKTVVPLAIYFSGGWAKCELGIAEGKTQYDKRDVMRKRDQQRDIAREMNKRR